MEYQHQLTFYLNYMGTVMLSMLFAFNGHDWWWGVILNLAGWTLAGLTGWLASKF